MPILLIDACIAALALANGDGASPFPRGIDDVEIQITEREGAAHVQIRVSARSPSEADRIT